MKGLVSGTEVGQFGQSLLQEILKNLTRKSVIKGQRGFLYQTIVVIEKKMDGEHLSSSTHHDRLYGGGGGGSRETYLF